MIKSHYFSSLVLCILHGLLPGVQAGAGAVVNGCFYYKILTGPVNVSLSVDDGHSNICMNAKGQDASGTVTSPGVTCFSVGYVEEKGSSSHGDTCATTESSWYLGFSTSDGASGSVRSSMAIQWFGPNTIELKTYSNGTSICNGKDRCSGTSATWKSGTTGPLYMQFSPVDAGDDDPDDDPDISSAHQQSPTLVTQPNDGLFFDDEV